MFRQRKFGSRHSKYRRTPVMGGHWRLRQLRQFNFGFQYIEGDQLRVVVPLPGVDKSTLKIKAKSDIVSISANIQAEFRDYAVRPDDNWDIMLDYPVIVDTNSAKYKDGILMIDFKLIDPPKEIKLEE